MGKSRNLPLAIAAALSMSVITGCSSVGRSYETQGYTVTPALATKLKKTKSPYENIRFMIFNRDGLQCRNCKATIIREERNSRRIYWCPTCQKAPSS